VKGSNDVTVALRLSALMGMLSTARWSAVKKASKPPAFEGLSETLQVLEVQIRIGIAPPTRLDAHGAHERAEAQLPVGHWNLIRFDWRAPA
jgi:hypothetical protein